jgi:hypothetical protein
MSFRPRPFGSRVRVRLVNTQTITQAMPSALRQAYRLLAEEKKAKERQKEGISDSSAPDTSVQPEQAQDSAEPAIYQPKSITGSAAVGRVQLPESVSGVYPLITYEKQFSREDGQVLCLTDYITMRHPGPNGEINVDIMYFPNPHLAARVIPLTPQKEVAYVAVKPEGFLIKQSGSKERGRGSTYLDLSFSELYRLSWINPAAKMELGAIEEAIRFRKDQIEKHLGSKIDF